MDTGTLLKKHIDSQTWLTWLLRPVDDGCRCTEMIEQMNQWGLEGCKRQRRKIVDHLTNQAIQYAKSQAIAKIAVSVIRREANHMLDKVIEEASEAPTIESSHAEEPISVVWVYYSPAAEGDELLYSVRSAASNLTDASNFVICGDKPSWWTGPHIHSPKFSRSQAVKKFGTGRWHKEIDSIVKLQKIIDSPAITDRFLWMYDDTFVVQMASTAWLAKPRAGGSLHSKSFDKPVRNRWRELRRRTAIALKDQGRPTRDFSTHYPVVFDKQKLQEVIDLYRPMEHPRAIESLYLNHVAEGPPKSTLGVFQYTVTPRKGWKVDPAAVVVNVGKWNHHVAERIIPMFPATVSVGEVTA